MTTTYLAGWNLPGYLPTTPPEEFETLQEAVEYLRQTVERWQDEDWEEADPDVLDSHEIVDDCGHGTYKDLALWTEIVIEPPYA